MIPYTRRKFRGSCKWKKTQIPYTIQIQLDVDVDQRGVEVEFHHSLDLGFTDQDEEGVQAHLREEDVEEHHYTTHNQEVIGFIIQQNVEEQVDVDMTLYLGDGSE